MLNSYLEDWEAVENIESIRNAAQQVWGKNVRFSDIQGKDSPYSEFEWHILLYNRFDIKMEYDRSMLEITVNTAQGYILLDKLTNEKIFLWFESCKPQNLLHNFQVLDRVVRGCSV